MSNKSLFPGTFDPFTLGHLDIVERALELFDEVVVAVGVNANKKHLFSLAQRQSWLEDLFANEPRVSVAVYEGLTAVFAAEIGASHIIRGLRTTQDFTYEQQIAFVNEEMAPRVKHVFILSDQKNSSVSSTIVRDLIRYNGEYSKYVPPIIDQHIKANS
ncbi:MAG: pantetheine-phosphate adenylyltransferase [Bacteroidia bacterium]